MLLIIDVLAFGNEAFSNFPNSPVKRQVLLTWFRHVPKGITAALGCVPLIEDLIAQHEVVEG